MPNKKREKKHGGGARGWEGRKEAKNSRQEEAGKEVKRLSLVLFVQ